MRKRDLVRHPVMAVILNSKYLVRPSVVYVKVLSFRGYELFLSRQLPDEKD